MGSQSSTVILPYQAAGQTILINNQGPPGPAGAGGVTSSASAPSHTATILWLDTSTVPPVLRYWDGAAWTALATGGGGTSGFTWVDNGNGTASITATGTASITDNGNGLLTLTGGSVVDNGNGLLTIA